MPSENKKFADKYPKGTVVSEQVQQAVRDHMEGQTISCDTAHRLAAALNVKVRDIGTAIDLQEGRIRECQLGLFGHGASRKAIKPADEVTPELKSSIESALIKGRLPCAHAWRIADSADLPRTAVAAACELLNIKISKCKLGAF